jgi:hypothetical protein
VRVHQIMIHIPSRPSKAKPSSGCSSRYLSNALSGLVSANGSQTVLIVCTIGTATHKANSECPWT